MAEFTAARVYTSTFRIMTDPEVRDQSRILHGFHPPSVMAIKFHSLPRQYHQPEARHSNAGA